LKEGDRSRFQAIGLLGSEPWKNPNPVSDWPQWAVKTVYHWNQSFPANETVEIEHSYSPYYGGGFASLKQVQTTLAKQSCGDQKELEWLRQQWTAGEYGYHAYVAYILITGKNWKGPIGKFTLELDQLKNTITVACFPKPLVLDAQGKKSVTVKNFTPTTNLKVSFIEPPVKK